MRQAFAALSPALAKPVPQSCLDAIASPQRTLLGAAQLAAFTRAIRASTATFKVVVNPEPMLQLYALPYDRWEGYAAERARVLDVLQSVRNVVVLTTDMHAHVIGEIRRDTFAPGGPLGTGIWEVVTGPVATNTYAKEIDSFLGAPGFGAVVTGAFFKPRAAARPRPAVRPDRRLRLRAGDRHADDADRAAADGIGRRRGRRDGRPVRAARRPGVVTGPR